MPDDARRRAFEAAIEDCRGRDIAEVADALELDLERQSGWLTGPCPECGGTDRFNIKLADGGFFCRKGCAAKGAGPIDLVMVVKRLEFLKAVEWLHGDLSQPVSEAELQRRRDMRAKAKRDRDAQAADYRAWAMRDARLIWDRAAGQDRGPVRDYLALRGIAPDLLPELPACLRHLPDHPYVVKRGGDLVTMHRGPAMIAGIRAPDGRLTCVHQTWFDLSRPRGKPVILWHGKPQRNKLTRGSQAQAAIRLVTPERFTTLVMAEGIETTLTAAIAWAEALAPAAFWAGISLGHMGGKMAKAEGLPPGIPDMDDTHAFYPPPWVERLIFVMDGDSAPGPTRAKLECGLRRAMAMIPGLKAQIVPAGDGVDLNDVLMGPTPAVLPSAGSVEAGTGDGPREPCA